MGEQSNSSIRNVNDHELFWSNIHGWADEASADVYSPDERASHRLPIEGEWVPSARAVSHPVSVSAKIASDDGVEQAEFDATSWFAQASDEDIVSLRDIGFRGDYQADDVAHDLRGTDGGIDRVLSYVEDHPARETGQAVGFEVVVDEDQAIAWIVENRPHLNVGPTI